MQFSFNWSLLKKMMYAWVVFNVPFLVSYLMLMGDDVPSHLADAKSIAIFVFLSAALALLISILGAVKFSTKHGGDTHSGHSR